MATQENSADRIALLHSGQVIFVGTPTDFRASTHPTVRAFAHRDAARLAARDLAEAT